MSESCEDVKKVKGAADAEEQKKVSASRFFRFIAQADSEDQMSVARWLMCDPLYECIWILHDKDVNQDDDKDDCQTTFDGSDRIKPHFHFIVRIPKKCSALTMTKRFGGYINFQRCTDPFDYAYYLTHEVFRARNKHRYSESEICGDMDFKKELRSKIGRDVDLCKQWQRYLNDANGNIQLACQFAVRDGNGALIKQLKSHAYFYERFFNYSGYFSE